MAVAVSTDVFRTRMADWLMTSVLDAVMAFGSGGVDGQGTVISPAPAQMELNSQVGELPLYGVKRDGDTVVTVTGRISQGVFPGEAISEAGLKVGGEFYAFRNFAPKIFEDDEFFDVTIEIKF